MNQRLGLLCGLLALQIALAAALLWRTPADAPGGGPLMAVEAASVAVLRIADGDGEVITLRRRDGGWWLDGAALPADADKVDEVLGKLVGLRAPWPVATTGSAAERFEVTGDDHQRRVELLGDGEQSLAVLFLGTSPGYGRVHGRLDGSDDVYALDIANYEVPVALDDWLDRTLLAADGEVHWVDGAAGWRLERADEGWLLDGAAARQEAVEPVLARLSDLRVLGVLDAAGAGAAFEDRGTVRYQDDAGEHAIAFAFDADEDRYVVSSSRVEGRFTVASYIAEQILVDAAAFEVSDSDPADGDAATEVD